MRLGRATLAHLPAGIAVPRGRTPLATGIVHFGPGAFHRAHQAAFIDRLLDDDPRWGIAAVSLRSGRTVAELAAQDGLYTLAVEDVVPSLRVLGAHSRFIGPGGGAELAALLSDPGVALVTSTVTEKGYCLTADGDLDLSHPDIVADLNGGEPVSLIGWLVAGLAARRATGIAPFVAMPCDNLADNGRKLHAALVAFARATDPALADWIAGEVRVPSTMVDAITPASDDALYARVSEALGVEDRAAVRREAFAQWVIEDVGPIGPDLGAAGATITHDVAGYERAKLRILNGAHSTLAYLGLLRGHTIVAEAMADPALANFVAALVREEVVPALAPVPGLDHMAYAETVFARFRNPAIAHRLDQIAQDGSQKLPYRIGDTLIARHRAGQGVERLLTAYAAWIVFLCRRARSGTAVIDPLAPQLAARANQPAPDAARAVARDGLGIPALVAREPALLERLCAIARQLDDIDARVLG